MAGGSMFGYIVMNKPEIKFKDFDLYRSFYCGLCREVGFMSLRREREQHGVSFILCESSPSAKMLSQNMQQI